MNTHEKIKELKREQEALKMQVQILIVLRELEKKIDIINKKLDLKK